MRDPCGWNIFGVWTCYFRLITSGSCVFGATPYTWSSEHWVGTDDVADLTRDSILRFGGTVPGYIGSKGEMPCMISGLDGRTTVEWGLYHS